MKHKKEYIILLLVIGLITTYLAVRHKGQMHYALPLPKKIEKKDITKLAIRKDGSELTLTRENDTWRILPEKYPADGGLVDKMTDALGGITVTALVSESKNYPLYDLDEKHRLEIEAYGGDSLLRRIDIGKPASSYRHTFIKLDDDPRVYHAKGSLRTVFDRTADNLRDKTVLAIQEDITGMELRKGKTHLVLVKTPAPVPVTTDQEKGAAEAAPPAWRTDDGKPVNEKEVDELIRQLRNLKCDGFVEGGKKEDLKSPIYMVSLQGAKTYTLSLYRKKDERLPAVSSGSDYPFYISGAKADRIMKDPKAILKQGK